MQKEHNEFAIKVDEAEEEGAKCFNAAVFCPL